MDETTPAEKKKLFAVNLPVTFITPVTDTPVIDVIVSRFDPEVTLNASVTPDPPTVSLPEIVGRGAESS